MFIAWLVMPANAGIQVPFELKTIRWIPASAGMTEWLFLRHVHYLFQPSH
jgi:hypothetical protein